MNRASLQIELMLCGKPVNITNRRGYEDEFDHCNYPG